MKSVSTHLLVVFIDLLLPPSTTEWGDKEHGLCMQIQTILITKYERLSKFFNFPLPIFLIESANDNNAYIII